VRALLRLGESYPEGRDDTGSDTRGLPAGEELGTVETIYLEGGEPFLYYPVMVRAAKEAAALEFRVGLLSNVYWATTVEDAIEWLRPLKGLLHNLTISTDRFHYGETVSVQARNAQAAAERLGIPIVTIICAVPEGAPGYPAQAAGEPVESGAIMFKVGQQSAGRGGDAPTLA